MTRERFAALAARYGDTVFRVAFSTLRNRADAEDAAQNALLKLYQETREFESDDHVKHWLIRVTVNESRRLLRTPWRRNVVPLEDVGEGLTFPTQEHSELFYAVMALPAKYRTAVYLYYYEEYSVTEVAAAMGANPSTVQTWLMRARGKLKDTLEEAWSNA